MEDSYLRDMGLRYFDSVLMLGLMTEHSTPSLRVEREREKQVAVSDVQ